MATLSNITITETGHLTIPSGTTAQRPSTPTVTTSLNLPLGISINNLRLYIPTFWSTYQNLPAYLTGLITTTYINSSDSFTCTVSHACTIYMLRDPAWNAVDTTGWTLVESGKNYGISSSISVYSKNVTAGTYTLDDNSAMYMFDFGTNVNVRKGMTRFNTDSQCIEWYDGLKWVNDIVRDGLICHVDMGNSESYPGMGNVLRDISGHGRHFTITGGATFSNTYYGVMSLGASTAGLIYQSDMNLSSGKSTIMAAARYTTGTHARVITASNNWLLGNWSNSTENYHPEGWVSTTGAGSNDTNWRIYAGTADTVADNFKIYVNGTQTASGNGGSQGPNQIQINGYGVYYQEPSDCQFSFLLAYNRVLTDAEVKQNYNAFRYRFGL